MALAMYVFSSDPQSFWLVCTALLLSLNTTGSTFLTRLILIGACAIALLLGVCLTGWFAHSLWLILFLPLIAMINLYIAFKYTDWYLSALIIIACCIIAGMSSSPDRITSFFYIALGSLLVLSGQLIFAYRYHFAQWQEWLILSLRYLEKCTCEILNTTLGAAYSQNQYVFERRIHTQKVKWLLSFNTLRAYTEKVSQDKLKEKKLAILKALDNLYDALLECSQIRTRISDFTVFNLCSNELQDIATEIERIFNTLINLSKGHEATINESELEDKIKNLEINYTNVLRVAAREPLVFSLFIAALQGLERELSHLYKVLHALKGEAA